ncbi:MAG: hypothetical protein AAGA68_18750 [Pseudomonadota bacterium]
MSDISSSLKLPSINITTAPALDGGPERAPTPQPPESQDSTVGYRVSISDRARALVAKALQARAEAAPVPPQARELPEGVEVSRGGGTVEISREVESARGGTQTRELSVTVDPQAQTVSRERSVTGAGGRSITVSGSLTRVEGGFESSFTVTGPNGNEFNRTLEQSFDAEKGTFSRSVVVTGDTYTVSRSTEVERNDGGFDASFNLSVERNDLPQAQGGPEIESDA